jgi:tetratricopeptide (TPR) repeat protein
MAPSRIELLRSFIAQRPDDPFPRYGLAMEHKNAGRLADAKAEFETLLAAHADYVPAYLHAGATLVALGLVADAREVYRRGVEAAIRKSDGHARGELEAALVALG